MYVYDSQIWNILHSDIISLGIYIWDIGAYMCGTNKDGKLMIAQVHWKSTAHEPKNNG